ncbi:MAG: type IV toxin-antitoxin system AbiEi family antitoxin [Pseudomonadota bacterium]
MKPSLRSVLDAAERRGKLNLRTEEIAASLPGVSPEALRQALQRQKRSGRLVRASRGSQHWVIVPIQDALDGAPPVETWLDNYMAKSLGIPYYVGMLSAAAAYGVSPQAIMVTQVVVPKARRPLKIGQHELHFFEQCRVDEMPLNWHKSSDGRYRISSPELTAVDIVARHAQLGGIARALEVVQGLTPHMTPDGLKTALSAAHEVPTAQRLGTLLSMADASALAEVVKAWLADKRTRRIPLELGKEQPQDVTRFSEFKVVIPLTFTPANT